jgi:hypothetical protein
MFDDLHPISKADIFQTSYLQALALLQDFDKGRCLRKGIMGMLGYFYYLVRIEV